MKTDLDLLIHELRKEKNTLEALINDCLGVDKDYLAAAYYHEALMVTQQQLSKFLRLKNPHIERIQNNALYIKKLRKRLKKSHKLKGDFSWIDIETSLLNTEERLEQLRSKKVTYRLDSMLLHDLLNDLLEKKIKCIKLELQGNDLVVLGLRLIKTDLIIELSGIVKNPRKNFRKREIVRLNKIGFAFHGVKLERVLEDFKASEILNVITFLSRIIYDFFQFNSHYDDPVMLIIES